MNQIAGIGSRTCLWPFKYFGVETFFVPEQGSAIQLLEQALRSGTYAIIIVTESVYREAEEWIESRRESYLPAITLIPDAGGTQNLALERISSAIRSAVGMDIA